MRPPGRSPQAVLEQKVDAGTRCSVSPTCPTVTARTTVREKSRIRCSFLKFRWFNVQNLPLPKM